MNGHGTARRFLDLLDETGESWCFRTFDDKGRGAGRNYAGALDDLATALQLANNKGRGVFVVVNAGGQTDAEITDIRAVFADFDGAALPEVFPLEPHVIIESSPGKFHAYWLVDGLPLDQFKPTQQAIAAQFGSDPAVCNLSRVMRLPGFAHCKADPFLTDIIHESGGLPYAADRVLSAFPAVANEPLQREERAAAGEIVVNADRHTDLLKLSSRFARQVHFEGLSADAALGALMAEATRGRWTREVPTDEIRRAFEGALDKCRRGEWRRADQGPPLETDSGEPAPPRLVAVDIGDIMTAQVAAPDYVIEPLIPFDNVTLLGGHGGVGKSLFALSLAAHAPCGKAWANFPVTRCNAVYIALEDSAALMRYRLRRIIETYRLDAGAIVAGLRIFDGSDAEAALMTEVSEFGSRKLVATQTMLEIEEAVAGAGLVVIDNASDAFDGDENNRRQVRTFVRRLTRLAKNNHAGVVLLAHIDKHAARHSSNGNSYSGSTAWHNSARSRLALITENEVIELHQEKLNLGKKADPILLSWNDTGVLVPGLVGPSAKGASDAVMAQTDAAAVLDVIQTALVAGITIPTANAGPSTAWHALEPLPELGQVYRTTAGRKRVQAALLRLSRDGLIVRETFLGAGRHFRERWQLAQPFRGGENLATKSARVISPIPPALNSRTLGGCASRASSSTSATRATRAAEDYQAAKDGDL